VKAITDLLDMTQYKTSFASYASVVFAVIVTASNLGYNKEAFEGCLALCEKVYVADGQNLARAIQATMHAEPTITLKTKFYRDNPGAEVVLSDDESEPKKRINLLKDIDDEEELDFLGQQLYRQDVGNDPAEKSDGYIRENLLKLAIEIGMLEIYRFYFFGSGIALGLN